MADFLTTAGCAHRLEQLVTGARERLTLISPFLQVAPILLERLLDAERRGVAITVVFGKDELRADQRRHLERVRRLRLLFLENLHAKCYANEVGMVVTSMNLYQFSEKTNREMGVFLSANEPAYAAAFAEVDSIVAAARTVPLVPDRQATSRPIATQPPQRFIWQRPQPHDPLLSRGFCIRCHRGIGRHAAKPFCVDCFATWDAFGNAEYPERFCHECGAEGGTCAARPLCMSCFRAATF